MGRWAKQTLCAISCMLVAAGGAHAGIVTGTFSGTISSGYDYDGVFGAVGQLDGQSITGTFSYNTSNFNPADLDIRANSSSARSDSLVQDRGALTIIQTINGHSQKFVSDPGYIVVVGQGTIPRGPFARAVGFSYSGDEFLVSAGTFGETNYAALVAQVPHDQPDNFLTGPGFVQTFGHQTPPFLVCSNGWPAPCQRVYSTGAGTIIDEPTGAVKAQYQFDLNYVSAATPANPGVVYVHNVAELQNIQDDLTAHYVLANDIDAKSVDFSVIAPDSLHPFEGVLDGNGHTIANLQINAPAGDDLHQAAGLFGYTSPSSVLDKVTLKNSSVTSSAVYVGALVGWNQGEIDYSHVAGTTAGANSAVGGIAGVNFAGSILSSTSSGQVIAGDQASVGGIAGGSSGSIALSSSAATVVGGSNGSVGGLAGYSIGLIDKSYATGNVTGANSSFIGGLVGSYSGGGPLNPVINQSYASGNVNGGPESYIGGLLGWNYDATVTRSYALGDVTGSNSAYIGGLLGKNGSVVDQSYAVGHVSDPSAQAIGGLFGRSDGPFTNSYWDTQTSGQPSPGSFGPNFTGAGLTTNDFKSGALPNGFDPTDWTTSAGSYPRLAWQQTPSTSLPSPLDLLDFASAAYGSKSKFGPPPGWNEIAFVTIDTEGYMGRAYINSAQDQIVLAIAGTDSVVDWIGPDLTFISPGDVPSDAFREYVGFAATQLRYLEHKYSGARITLTGHSLGGAIAQVLGSAAGVDVTSFDAPGSRQTAKDTGLALILGGITKRSDTPVITNYRVYGDLVSTVGEQFGSTIIFDPPISKTLVNTFPVSAAKPMHEVKVLRERLISGASVTQEMGPTVSSVAGSAILSGIIGPGILDWTNIGVFAYEFLFQDPSAANDFWFTVDGKSPRISAIQFPYLALPEAFFELEALTNGTWSERGTFPQLAIYDFAPSGVDGFHFSILDGNGLLPASSVGPFTFGISFASDGIVNGELRSAATAPEPGTLPLFLGIGGIILISRQKLVLGSRIGLSTPTSSFAHSYRYDVG